MLDSLHPSEEDTYSEQSSRINIKDGIQLEAL